VPNAQALLAALQGQIGGMNAAAVTHVEPLELDATLRLRSSSEGSQESRRGNTMTPISGVSSGFGEVLAHDAIVWPEQCGGPVLDLDGRAVGLLDVQDLLAIRVV
jgi:serine protease Do